MSLPAPAIPPTFGPWTVHTLHRTPEAIQIHPRLPLGLETWGHRRGDPPWLWYPWLPRCMMPPGTGMECLDMLATKEPGNG